MRALESEKRKEMPAPTQEGSVKDTKEKFIRELPAFDVEEALLDAKRLIAGEAKWLYSTDLTSPEQRSSFSRR